MRAWKPVYTQVGEGECACLCVTESENGNMHQLEGPIKSKWNPDTIQSSLLPHYLTVYFQELGLFDPGLLTSVNLLPSLLILHSFAVFILTLKLQELKLWIKVLNKHLYMAKKYFKASMMWYFGLCTKGIFRKTAMETLWKRTSTGHMCLTVESAWCSRQHTRSSCIAWLVLKFWIHGSVNHTITSQKSFTRGLPF